MVNTRGILQQALQFPARQLSRAFFFLVCGALLSSAIALPVRAADDTLPSLCGVPLGARTANRSNPLDRTTLVGRLDSPTAVLVPMQERHGKREVAGMSVLQRPSVASSDLIPLGKNQYMPQWAESVAFAPTPDQVEWVYNRKSYAMGFEVTRSGIVDGIVASGIEGGNTQLLMQDNYQPVNLGESLSVLRKDWGQADVTKTYPDPTAKNNAASAKEAPKTVVMTYKIEGQQSYWVTITTRYNRIVRISLAYGPDMESTDAFPKPRPLVIN